MRLSDMLVLIEKPNDREARLQFQHFIISLQHGSMSVDEQTLDNLATFEAAIEKKKEMLGARYLNIWKENVFFLIQIIPNIKNL